MLKLMQFIRGDHLYNITFYSRGFMGNRYVAGKYSFVASRKEVEKAGSAEQLCFWENYKELSRHYKIRGESTVKVEFDIESTPLWEERMLANVCAVVVDQCRFASSQSQAEYKETK